MKKAERVAILCRHLEPEELLNREARVTANGERQAVELGKKIYETEIKSPSRRKVRIDGIDTSPLLRAQDSTNLVARTLEELTGQKIPIRIESVLGTEKSVSAVKKNNPRLTSEEAFFQWANKPRKFFNDLKEKGIDVNGPLDKIGPLSELLGNFLIEKELRRDIEKSIRIFMSHEVAIARMLRLWGVLRPEFFDKIINPIECGAFIRFSMSSTKPNYVNIAYEGVNNIVPFNPELPEFATFLRRNANP